jgi:hypothetical protein
MREYKALHHQLMSMTPKGKKPIVIPGNHDERWMGNALGRLGQQLRQLADLQWSKLIVDEDLSCVFFCFDSSIDGGNWARGKVSHQQMLEVGTQFEQQSAVKDELPTICRLP